MPFLSSEAAGRIALMVLLAISTGVFFFVVHLEATRLGGAPPQIDEYYFSACAVRGLGTGAVPIAACHDNKAPLIFLIYEVIFKATHNYDLSAIRAVALATILADIGILAAIAYRIAGGVASVVTASLFLLCIASNIQLMALKTELVGGLFVSASLLVLLSARAPASIPRLALAGFLTGLAVVTKQTYAFSGFAVIAWMLLNTRLRHAREAWAFLARSTLFGMFVLLPFGLFWLNFHLHGVAADFLASFFLYPKLYGPSCAGGLKSFLECSGGVVSGLADHLLLATVTAGGFLALALSGPVAAPATSRYSDPRWLVLLLVLFLAGQLMLTPWWFAPYVMMVVGPMALLSGIAIADNWKPVWSSAPKLAQVLMFALIAGATLTAAKTWHSNAMMEDAMLPPGLPAVADGPPGRYAFEMGDRPDFYAKYGFVPATSVQFTWGLPGTPEIWSYVKPPANSATRRWLDVQQSANLSRLYAEFSRTPPQYILFRDNYLRATNGSMIIPGFQSYLNRNCRLIPETQIAATHSLYACGTAIASLSRHD